MTKRLLVSIFSDASLDPPSGIGGWGGWAKSTRGRRYGSGAFKRPMPSSNAAELGAALNTLALALTFGIAEKTDKILFQIDNLHALGVVKGTVEPGGPEEREMRRLLDRLIEEHDLVILAKHVKGHHSDGTPRTWVNGLCDRLAGEAMRRARAAKRSAA